jgi:hypothetical protein
VGDYLDKLGTNRADGLEHAATAKSHRKLRRKGTSLTTIPKRAKLRVKRVATKPPGKETRGTTKKTPSEKAKMAKKSKRSKKRRLAAQQAATRKTLRAAKAKRAGKSRRGSSKRKARKSGKRKSAKRVAAGKKAARTRKRRASVGASEPTKRKRSKRKSGKRRARKVRAAHSIKLPRGKRGAKKRVGVHVKVGKKRRSRGFSVPRKTKRVYVIAAEKSRRRRKRKAKANPAKRRRHSSGRRKGAMENPMDGVELFIGAVTGLAGFLTADVLDRFLATHPLTVSTAASGSTAATYTDTPPTSGDYQGLFNATAICAPMDATRWLAGLGVATVPLVIAHFISAPKGRAALQFFGYAAGIRVVGKGLIDMIAQLTQPTQLGQQLYDGEMRAAALKAGNGTIASGVNLPSSGLGRARLGTGKPCAPCATKKMGAGYPSAPREVTAVTNNSTPTTQNQPTSTPTNTAPTASAPAATPPAPPAAANTLTGARFINGLPRRNPNWGYQGDE